MNEESNEPSGHLHNNKSIDNLGSKESSHQQSTSSINKLPSGVMNQKIFINNKKKNEWPTTSFDLICTTLLKLINTYEKVATMEKNQEDQSFQIFKKILKGSLKNEVDSNKLRILKKKKKILRKTFET